MRLPRSEARALNELLLSRRHSLYWSAIQQIETGLDKWENRHKACKDVCDVTPKLCSDDPVEF